MWGQRLRSIMRKRGGSPFTGKIPGGPKFDLLAPFRGWFGGGDEPEPRGYAGDLLYRGEAVIGRDLLYRGEPTQIVTLPFKGEIPEMIYT